MSDIDFQKLTKEIEERAKATGRGFYTTISDVLSERKIKANLWPDIIKEAEGIMKGQHPEIFPDSNRWEKIAKPPSFESRSDPRRKTKGPAVIKITPAIKKGAWRNQYLLGSQED